MPCIVKGMLGEPIIIRIVDVTSRAMPIERNISTKLVIILFFCSVKTERLYEIKAKFTMIIPASNAEFKF